jgi:DNA-directed RNA polymerase subunit RPC12/RpoP
VDRSRPQPARRPGIAPRQDATAGDEREEPTNENARQCPWCGSRNTTFYKRGLTGPTDERDQYITCNDCGRLTYEIVSRTSRDMRVGQFRAGGTFRDNARQTKYTISRVLKVGLNEFLLYLKPILPGNEETR